MWVPHGYTVQADIGAITGAQASIYARAKVMLEHAVPLLDGLTSLSVDPDLESQEAARIIIRSSLNDLVTELGAMGGPRIARIDTLFELLLGTDIAETDPDEIEGQLGELRDRFGMQQALINTVDEEKNLTNFLMLLDHVMTLRWSWEHRKDAFDISIAITPGKQDKTFLGTQLVLLSRSLAVIVESVREVCFAMDSVFFGAAERQMAILSYSSISERSLTVAQLLEWVSYFASIEGPQLVRDAGKEGVVAFAKTIAKLKKLVVGMSAQPPNNLPASFYTARVQRAVGDLARQIGQAESLAANITAPMVPTAHQALLVAETAVNRANTAHIKSESSLQAASSARQTANNAEQSASNAYKIADDAGQSAADAQKAALDASQIADDARQTAINAFGATEHLDTRLNTNTEDINTLKNRAGELARDIDHLFAISHYVVRPPTITDVLVESSNLEEVKLKIQGTDFIKNAPRSTTFEIQRIFPAAQSSSKEIPIKDLVIVSDTIAYITVMIAAELHPGICKITARNGVYVSVSVTFELQMISQFKVVLNKHHFSNTDAM